MLSLIASAIGLIPGLTSLAEKWHASALDSKVRMYMAKTGASRDVAVEVIRAQAQVQTKWWFVAVIPPLFAVPYVIYTWKAVAWDKVLSPIILGHTGNTEAIGGYLGTVFVAIVSFYFLHGMKPSDG